MILIEKLFLGLVVIMLSLACAAAPVLGDKTPLDMQKPAAKFNPLPLYQQADIPPRELRDRSKVSGKSDYCIDCHRQETPGIFEEWVDSAHARIGVACAAISR